MYDGSWSYQPAAATVSFNNWTALAGSAFALADCIPPTITGLKCLCWFNNYINRVRHSRCHYTWTSANTAVATVSSTGVVTGISAGASIITFTDIAGCQQTATVTVNTAPGMAVQPTAPAAACPGSGTQTMTVTATGTGITYRWRKGGFNQTVVQSAGREQLP